MKLGKDVLIYGFSDILTKCLSFVVFPIYTHLFTLNEFGTMALVGTIGGILNSVTNFGVINAVQRYYYEKESAKKFVVSSGFWISCIWTGIVTLIFLIATYFFRHILETQFNILQHYIVLVVCGNFFTLIFY